MGRDSPPPVTPTRQTSNGQIPNEKNIESPYRKRTAQDTSGRRGRKEGSAKRNALPRTARRGYQAIQDPQPTKEDSTDEVEDTSVQTTFQLRRVLFEEVQQGSFDWESEDLGNRVQKLLYGCDRAADTLLHQMVDYLRLNSKGNVAVTGTSNARGLRELAKFALGLDPRLLKEKVGTDGTPLQYALEKGTELFPFAEHLCNVAEELMIPGSKMEPMNACQEAIHAKKENMTCLHYAISEGLSISHFLVEKASRNTLREKCGPDSNTPLHEAVHFDRLGPKTWLDLVDMILEKEPGSVLALNKQGHSPYRYHMNTGGKRAWEIDAGDGNGIQTNTTYEDSVNDEESFTKASLPANEKEDANGDSENLDAKSQVDTKSKTKANNDKKRLVAQARQWEQALDVQDTLLEHCLQYGGHKEAFTGLWGSFDGNPRTWINLLDVELSDNFDTKLNFRQLEHHLGFVGVKVPPQEVQFIAREQPVEKHIVVRFFNWLRGKGVIEILKVVVKDDCQSPCSDEVIEESLWGFNVRYLDWDREDLSSKVIEDTMEDARGLSLYWSGNNAMLREWTDLVNLEMLKQVHLTVQQKWDSRTKTEENIRNFKQILKGAAPRIAQRIEVSGGEIPQKQEGNGGQGGIIKTPGISQLETNQWLAKMEQFTEGITDDPSGELPPVKVAIIDDGVDLYGQYHIADGTSFIQPQNQYNGPPEYFPSALGHGTAMAEIMHTVCPSVRLYIAKLNETIGRRRFKMKYAAKAIQWAVDQDVHIISMSWTIDDADVSDVNALTTALENAKAKKIIMFCAARDEGIEEDGRKVYPYSAAPDVIIRIGATDQYGRQRPYVPGKEIDYLLPGVGLAQRSVALPDVNKMNLSAGEGSSEATALAAGVAALVLFCFVAVIDPPGIGEVKDPDRMKELFDEFADGHDQSVLPSVFVAAAEAARPKEGDFEGEDAEINNRMNKLIEACRAVITARKGKRAKAGVHRYP